MHLSVPGLLPISQSATVLSPASTIHACHYRPLWRRAQAGSAESTRTMLPRPRWWSRRRSWVLQRGREGFSRDRRWRGSGEMVPSRLGRTGHSARKSQCQRSVSSRKLYRDVKLPFMKSPLGRVISPCQTSVMAGVLFSRCGSTWDDALFRASWTRLWGGFKHHFTPQPSPTPTSTSSHTTSRSATLVPTSNIQPEESKR